MSYAFSICHVDNLRHQNRCAFWTRNRELITHGLKTRGVPCLFELNWLAWCGLSAIVQNIKLNWLSDCFLYLKVTTFRASGVDFGHVYFGSRFEHFEVQKTLQEGSFTSKYFLG
jgi:hypothetical protein